MDQGHVASVEARMGVGSPDTGVIDSCEYLCGAGSQTWVYQKSSRGS